MTPASIATHPLTLAIEVSNPSAQGAASTNHAPGTAPDTGPDALGPSVALARGPVILDQEPLRTPDARHDDDLMPAIDRMVRRAALTPADLDHVAVSTGPGGFTGLRVAVATAKAIGETIITRRGLTGDSARVCIAVPSASVVGLNWLQSRPSQRSDPGAFAVALASKRDTAWLVIVDHHGTESRGQIATAADLAALHHTTPFKALIADQFLPDPMRDMARSLDIPIHPPIFSAAACARLAASINPVDPAALLPIYPREPEAVTKWRTLHPRQ